MIAALASRVDLWDVVAGLMLGFSIALARRVRKSTRKPRRRWRESETRDAR